MRFYPFFFWLSLFLSQSNLLLAARNEPKTAGGGQQVASRIAALEEQLAEKNRECETLQKEREWQKNAVVQRHKLQEVLQESIRAYQRMIRAQERIIEDLEATESLLQVYCTLMPIGGIALTVILAVFAFLNLILKKEAISPKLIPVGALLIPAAAALYSGALQRRKEVKNSREHEERIRADYQESLKKAQSAYDSL